MTVVEHLGLRGFGTRSPVHRARADGLVNPPRHALLRTSMAEDVVVGTS